MNQLCCQIVLFLLLSYGRAIAATNAPAELNPEILARAACSACHLFPDPVLLDRTIWPKHIFPKMRLYMGLDKADSTQSKDAKLLTEAGFFPAAPMIPESSWNRIANWYLAQAPEPTNTPSRNELIPIGLKQFKVGPAKFRRNPPLTTLARFDPLDQVILTADATEQSLDIVSPTGELIASPKVGNIVTSVQHTPEGFFLGCIGHFFPTEDRRGQVIFLKKMESGLERKVLLSELPRVAHIETGDFNQDGRVDFALCMFGFLTGRFSWFENLGHDEFREHELIRKPGAVKSVAFDFNQDGNLDLAVLFGQETDGMLMFMNDGKGHFTQKEVFRRAPVYGHSYFELADFNQDGEMDLLVTNGDNGDYESPPKPYHGVRIYLKKGDAYPESCFFPLHGAYKAVARDFDGDGDLDIAAISYFPDYDHSPRESFVYLENKGGLKFEPSTFRECIAGRWLTMDAGDIDSDGDEDIVLGSLIKMPNALPRFLKEMWEKQSPSLLFLMNQRK
ncbi:MAG TPA: VCBS repeat-containing protein [Verrucomicrobiae bacterium]|nr:VCBS repeat-containing protein [Verrucomicrobiae bacterium]